MWFPKQDVIDLVWNLQPRDYNIVRREKVLDNGTRWSRIVFEYKGSRYVVEYPTLEEYPFEKAPTYIECPEY